ncbi:MAG: T9SS type A sorting domain-containing protein [Bacteroidota bacterium]
MSKQPLIPTSGYWNTDNISSQHNQFCVVNVKTGGFNGIEDTMIIDLWNDTGWLTLAPLNSNTTLYGEIMKSNDQIFLKGRFTQFNNIIAPLYYHYTLLQYKGGIWDTVPGCLDPINSIWIDSKYECTNHGIYKMRTSRNLFLAKNYIEHFDPSKNKFDTICSYENIDNMSDPYILGGTDRLLIADIDSINSMPTNGFAYIDTSTIYTNNDTSNSQYALYTIDPKDDHIYTIIFKGYNPLIHEYDKQLIKTTQTTSFPQGTFGMMDVYDGAFMFFGTDINFDPTFGILCKNETKWKSFSDNQAKKPLKLTKRGFFYYDDTTKKAMILTDGAAIQGLAYLDLDSNCMHDSLTEPLAKGQLIKAISSSNNIFTAQTNNKGEYEIYVTPDTYTISGPFNRRACGYDTLQLHAAGNSASKDIPMKSPGYHDLNVRLLSSHITRWNDKSTITGLFENLGEPFDSAHFEFNIDGKLSGITSSNSNIKSINGNTISGQLYNVDYFEKRYVTLKAWVDTATTKPDTTVCSNLTGYIFTSEKDSTDNSDAVCQQVVYSFDPNHKTCDKSTIPVNTATKLEYFIEFQNEGNDDAYDVVITDQISPLLNLESFEVIGASHPYSYNIKNGLLTITFKGIYLKPKKVDDAMSKGFFKYAITTKGNLTNQTRINNTAYIYFDLNKPVITNTAVVLVSDGSNSTVGKLLSETDKLIVYPNPVNNALHITCSSATEAIIYNLEGKILATILMQNSEGTIDMSTWAKGIYIVRCGTDYQKIIKGE